MSIAGEKPINQATGQQAGRKGEFADRQGGQTKLRLDSNEASRIVSLVATSKISEACQKLAANKCTDALTHIAENYPGKNDDASKSRETAVWYLGNDVEALKHVMNNSKYEDSKKFAFLRLLSIIDKVDDVDALKTMLEFGKAPVFYPVLERISTIVDRVDDLKALTWVSVYSNEQSAKTAVKKIFEKIGKDSVALDALKNVVKDRKKDNVWRFAVEKLASIVDNLNELNALELLARYSEDREVQGKARAKIAQKAGDITQSSSSTEEGTNVLPFPIELRREEERDRLRRRLNIEVDGATRRFFGLGEEKEVEKSDGQKVLEIFEKMRRLGEIVRALEFLEVGVGEKINACESMCIGRFEEICKEIDEIYEKLDGQYNLPGRHKQYERYRSIDFGSIARIGLESFAGSLKADYYEMKITEIYEKLEELGDSPEKRVINTKRAELDVLEGKVGEPLLNRMRQRLEEEVQTKKFKSTFLRDFGSDFVKAFNFIHGITYAKALGKKIEVEKFERELRNILIAG